MSNAVFIKEVNNQPVIFNVDNAVDAARLEALQAVEMAEDMVGSVFGENSRYADNTTCTISANQDNPAFPYDVAFDASKIIETPKRYYGNLAKMAMPSTHYIDLIVEPSKLYTNNYGNGYLYGQYNTGRIAIIVCTPDATSPTNSKTRLLGNAEKNCSVPIRKGQKFAFYFEPSNPDIMRFIYAEGEI